MRDLKTTNQMRENENARHESAFSGHVICPLFSTRAFFRSRDLVRQIRLGLLHFQGLLFYRGVLFLGPVVSTCLRSVCDENSRRGYDQRQKVRESGLEAP